MPALDKTGSQADDGDPPAQGTAVKRRAAPAPRIKAAADSRQRRAKGEDTRERILASATEEFSRYGLEGASIRSIASRAGVSHTRFVYYFDSKEGLWHAVVERAGATLNARYAGPLEDAGKISDTELLKRLRVEFIRFAAEHPELHWIMAHSSREGGEHARWRTEQFIAPAFNRMIGLIASSQASGDHVAGDPAHLNFLFIGAAAQIFVFRGEADVLTNLEVGSEAFLEKHIERCLALFLPGDPAVAKATAKARKPAQPRA